MFKKIEIIIFLVIVWPIVFGVIEEIIVPNLPKPASLRSAREKIFEEDQASLFHAIVMSAGVLWAFYVYPEYSKSPVKFSTTFGTKLCMFSIGYFTYDLGNNLFERRRSRLVLLEF